MIKLITFLFLSLFLTLSPCHAKRSTPSDEELLLEEEEDLEALLEMDFEDYDKKRKKRGQKKGKKRSQAKKSKKAPVRVSNTLEEDFLIPSIHDSIKGNKQERAKLKKDISAQIGQNKKTKKFKRKTASFGDFEINISERENDENLEDSKKESGSKKSSPSLKIRKPADEY